MDGGYVEYVLVPSYKYLVKIRTAYGAVKNANLKPDDNVVIVGAGGLGLMAIQLSGVSKFMSLLFITLPRFRNTYSLE
jgi:propanol-preferring alcohol dehydrogenase